jgi:L-lactate transport
MWQQDYDFAGGSLVWSAALAAAPLLVLFYLLGVRRQPGWIAALAALAVTALTVTLGVGMPVPQALAAAAYGAAFGLFPISWIVFASLLLYRLAVDTGKFEVIKDSLGALSGDRRLQLLLIGFSFSAFIEGSAGFGSPVAVSAAMLTGLGFPAFYAAMLCLLGNTVPVAFGSIGIPILTLSQITGLSLLPLSAMTGRLLAPVALVVPIYLLVLMAGWRNTVAVWPAVLACGVTFGAVQLFVSNVVGPELTDILAAIASIVALVVLMAVWQPAETFRLRGDEAVKPRQRVDGRAVLVAWLPYICLVVFVLAWGYAPLKAWLDQWTWRVPVPGLHNFVQRVPPVTATASPYAAVFVFNWLSAAGTACVLATIVAAAALGVKPAQFGRIYVATLRQLTLPMVTIASVLAMAFLMNYAGMTSTLGLAFATTGGGFPFFSVMLGWLGVVLTGSVTSSNALFGNLQVVTAQTLGMSPVLTASANAAGGVMGKMISLQSIAVAVAATGMKPTDEGRLFSVMIRHSLALVVLLGLLALVYTYWLPGLIPQAVSAP